ncbi:MAG: hypothetical protein QXH71_03630 [Candidatus Anstonellaceae archaeon]
MKIKIKKEGNFLVLSFPKDYLQDLEAEEELECFFLSKDILLLTTKKSYEKIRSFIFSEVSPQVTSDKKIEQKSQQGKFENLNKEQLAVLEKLSKIKFSERTVNYIQKIFNQKEKEILNSLIKMGLVQLYKDHNKYPQGVYNINKIFYQQKPNSEQIEFLEKFGYLVFSDLAEAKNFFEKNKEKLASLEPKTIKGYDKKFYLVLPSFIEKNKQNLLDLLVEPRPISFLEQKLKINSEGILSILMFLAEDGLVFEKTKGYWQKV